MMCVCIPGKRWCRAHWNLHTPQEKAWLRAGLDPTREYARLRKQRAEDADTEYEADQRAAVREAASHPCVCEWCSAGFIAVRPDVRYCSDDCRHRAQRARRKAKRLEERRLRDGGPVTITRRARE